MICILPKITKYDQKSPKFEQKLPNTTQIKEKNALLGSGPKGRDFLKNTGENLCPSIRYNLWTSEQTSPGSQPPPLRNMYGSTLDQVDLLTRKQFIQCMKLHGINNGLHLPGHAFVELEVFCGDVPTFSASVLLSYFLKECILSVFDHSFQTIWAREPQLSSNWRSWTVDLT